MTKPRIMLVTTGRADYDLLKPLARCLQQSHQLELQLVAVGAHFSAAHGQTLAKIQQDGFKLHACFPPPHFTDSAISISQHIAHGLTQFADYFNQTKPDLLVVLGDRYELWSCCIAASTQHIPIAHIHGGEVTLGAIDDSIRHSLTKLSLLHFVALDSYASRVIQMGEAPNRVCVSGALGLDTLQQYQLLNTEQLEQHYAIDFTQDTAILTYHPVTRDNYQSAHEQMSTVLASLVDTPFNTVITMPNCDTGWHSINSVIQHYCQQMPQKFKLINSFGQPAYASALAHAKLMIGNSSSGIIESASFQLPVVNIGDRQSGRFKPSNIIDCSCDRASIQQAIEEATSDKFNQTIQSLTNPYGDGHASDRIMQVLNKLDYTALKHQLKKPFYDLPNTNPVLI